MRGLPTMEERTLADNRIVAESIRVRGIVQGVGFRPFIFQLAKKFNLRGRVWNDAQGVQIEVWGSAESLTFFRNSLDGDLPPLAEVQGIESSPIFAQPAPADFQIEPSRHGEVLTDVGADAATCPQCLADISDPANRRYRYPFTNCTHCGPRLSIIRTIPYDRANTSMSVFAMCPQCRKEYDDPGNRRFHAQANACPQCGPKIRIENAAAEWITDSNAIDELAHAETLLRRGHILAIKGIGGFHLACDATNEESVRRLRQRKLRYHKPFALMARDINVIKKFAMVSAAEEKLLRDKAAPIVLLRALNKSILPAEVAPDNNCLGFMLPYTPLHSLLLQAFDFPLLMTSANRSDAVQCIHNDQAREQLSEIADYFVFHDRVIINRLDDSLAHVVDKQTQVLRRARGYAPHPIKLPPGFEHSPDVLAMGAQLKNTFCLLKQDKAILSPHQGDLQDASVFHDYQHNIELFQRLYHHQPRFIAVDRHPDYLSTQVGRNIAASHGIELVEVQHHHAHIAACMAEHGVPLDTGPVLGIALDGLGFGDDGSLWGGEFLLADYCGFQRVARFQPIPMPGGAKAVIEPWRNAFAHLYQNFGWKWVEKNFPHLAFTKYMRNKEIGMICSMLEKGLNSPLASSAGRLFDAVAALLGICRGSVSYEGQAAIILGSLAEKAFCESEPYPYEVTCDDGEKLFTVQWTTFWQALLEDHANGASNEKIAGRFHKTLLHVLIDVIERLAEQYHFSKIVLSGGVMQNRLLLENFPATITKRQVPVFIPRKVPANDGGIAFGQAVVAAARYQTE